MKSKPRVFLALLCGLLAGVVQSANLQASSGDIVLGEWNSSFNKGLAYAQKNYVPMLLFWANPGCANCAALETACTSKWFRDWQANRRIVMVFTEGGSEAREFARNPSGNYPYICVCWEKSDGTASTNRFSGIAGQMPVKSTSAQPLTLEQQLAYSVDSFISDYEGGMYTGGHFKVTGSEGDRHEVLTTTTRLRVPLVRTSNLDQPGTNFLQVLVGGKVASEKYAFWLTGQTVAEFVVDVPSGLEVGSELELALLDNKRIFVESRVVPVVEEPEVSPRNPVWVGERTEFRYGEWTMDYELAAQNVSDARAKGETAYILAMMTGALWCPYCKGAEQSLLASPKFLSWAAANKVALVEFDQARQGKNGPRLLNCEPDPNLSSNQVSGASYLSRKGIAPEAAAAVIDRTTQYSTQKWLAPESRATRLGNPTFLLIRDDRVVGRFASWRDEDRVYDPDENIFRLNDLLKLDARASEADDYRTTTTRAYAMAGTESCTFQISDRSEFFNLSNLVAGTNSFMLAEGAPSDVVFTLYRGAAEVASGTNRLDVSLTSADLVDEFSLRVGAYADASVRLSEAGMETSEFTTSFTSKTVLVPEEGAIALAVGAGAEVSLVVKSGDCYRLDGFTQESLSAAFTQGVEDARLWTAKSDGVIALVAAAATVTYQSWKPGQVAFASSALSMKEGEASEIQLVVVRSAGSSGALKVRVVLDAEKSDAVDAARYDWKDVELAWADGEAGTRTLTFVLHDDMVFDGDQTLRFALTIEEGDSVQLGKSACALTIREDDKPARGYLAITGTAPAFARKMTVIAGAGTDLTIDVSRLNGADGEAEVVVTPSLPSLEAQKLVWEDRSREVVRQAVFTLPALDACPAGSLTFTLADPSIPATADGKILTVRLISPDAPGFAEPVVDIQGVRYVPLSRSVAVTDVQDAGKVSVTKVSGAVAPGLKVVYDKGEAGISMSGTPTAAGTWESVYQVREIRDGVAVAGRTVAFRVTVADPAKGAAGMEAVNPAVAVTRTFSDVPVIDESHSRLIGLMTVTVPATGRVSAKFTGFSGVRTMSSTSWESIREDGTLLTTIRTRDAKYSASVEVRPDGLVSLGVWDPDFAGDTLTCTAGDTASWSARNPASAWRGLYTVAAVEPRLQSGSEEIAPAGNPVLALKFDTATQHASGRVKFAGWLPNGKAVSGSATLRAEDGAACAQLPVFAQSSTDIFSVQLEIQRDSADKLVEYDALAAVGTADRLELMKAHQKAHRAISASANAQAYLAHFEPKTDVAEYGLSYTTLGAYYDPNEDFAACLATTEVSPTLTFSVASEDVTASSRYGKLGTPQTAVVRVSVDGLSSSGVNLSLNRETGLLSGSVTLPFAKMDVRGLWKAVLLPGWTGCGCFEGEDDYPFFVGACWFQDWILFSEDWATCTDQAEAEKRLTVKRGCAVAGETHVE